MIEQLQTFLEKQQRNTVFIKVRIIPKSSKNEVIDYLDDGSWKIRIQSVPQRGKANAELTSFLQKSLSVTGVEIVSGKNDRVKLLRIQL